MIIKKTITGLALVAILGSCSSKQDTGSIPPSNTTATSIPFIGYYAPNSSESQDLYMMDRILKGYVDEEGKVSEYEQSVARIKNSKQDPAVARPNKKDSVAQSPAKDGQGSGNTAAAEPVKKKKGWSRAAKGAVIGGGSGAVVGVIVSKDKVKGGILGGLLGAGAGYVIGNEIDKKKAKN